jgi:hypothetical protein
VFGIFVNPVIIARDCAVLLCITFVSCEACTVGCNNITGRSLTLYSVRRKTQSIKMGFFKDIGEKHERLKKRIHSYRFPLPKWGQKVMGGVYFCIPLVIGYICYNITQRIAEKNLGPNGEKLKTDFPYNDNSKMVAEQKRILQGVLDEARKKHESR